MKRPINLPPKADGREAPVLPESRQVTLVGAAGAGKSRFMEELVKLCGDRAFCVSALDGLFAERSESTLPGSVDALYRDALRSRSYMRPDAVTGLDRLAYMLLTDEFEHLLSLKEKMAQGSLPSSRPTRLDRLRELWERIFPSNRVVRTAGALMFATSAGDDLIGAARLSRGEQAVLYHIAAILYAPAEAVVFVEEPSLFVHPAIVNNLWNAIEKMRPDCRFIYDSVDVDFVNSRSANACIWVKSYDSARNAWDYEVLPASNLSDDLFIDLIGTRKPVLFIEGDAERSIDAKLYGLVFSDYTVRALGSCDKVIEATRAFSGLRPMHHLDSHGIVDRDRRTNEEVAYLRRKGILVPDVAEVENIFLLEPVVRVMARMRGRDPEKVAAKVRKAVFENFRRRLEEQALQHVRHRVKREAECKIDAKFTCITAMEMHLAHLVERLRPREQYDRLVAEFRTMVHSHDYAGVLRVFNHKPMLGDSGVDSLLGYRNRDAYVAGVLDALNGHDEWSRSLASAVRACFEIDSAPDSAPDNQSNPSSGTKKHSQPRKHARHEEEPDKKVTLEEAVAMHEAAEKHRHFRRHRDADTELREPHSDRRSRADKAAKRRAKRAARARHRK